MNLIPFPAHRSAGFHLDSVPVTHAPAFERLLEARLAAEFPGETFRVYPDWDGQNVMILLAPRGAADAARTVALDGRRVLGFELQVRKIIDQLLRSDAWKHADVDH